MPVPRSSSVDGFVAPSVACDESERRFDQRLGIGARVERVWIEQEGAAIELAGAGDARHRLAGEAAADGGAETRRGVRTKRGAGVRDKGFVAERGGVADQQARIELRRVDARLPQRCGRRDEGRLD